MTKQYVFVARDMVFRIILATDGWQAWCDDELLTRGHDDPQKAVDDLVQGATEWPQGVDPSLLGLPEHLDDWGVVR